MNIRRFFVPIVIACAINVIAQSGAAGRNGGLTTVKELLKRHNIDLTQSAVIGALQNQDPEVRALAAQELAEEKAVVAIPSILESLASEHVPEARVNIAFALAQLGETKGFSTLGQMCGDHLLKGFLRVQAARYMLDLGQPSSACQNAVVNLSQVEDDADSRVQAILLLGRFPNLSEEDSHRNYYVLLKALDAEQPSVKMAASQALAKSENRDAIPALLRAIANEPDEAVRSQMEHDLKILQQKR